MKNRLFSIVVLGAFTVSVANAGGWVYEDSGLPVQDCCHKAAPVKRVKRVVKKEPEVCLTCDYSKFAEAKLEPIGDEKLPPATLHNCGMK